MKRGNSTQIRLTDEERRELDEAARREDVPLSQIIRRAIRRELRISRPAKGSRP